MLPTLMLNKTYLNGDMAPPYGNGPVLGAAAPSPAMVPQQQVMYCYAPVGVSDPSSYAQQLSTLQAYQQQQQQLANVVAARNIASHMPQYQIQAAGGIQQVLPSYQYPMVLPQGAVTYISADQLYMAAGKKRTSDELMVNNAIDINSINSDHSNEAKKPRLDQGQVPVVKQGRVLHFRGVPSDATESEIIQLGIPFGSITNLVLAKKKNQAWVEMADVTYAQAAVNFYSQRAPVIRGHVIYVQFSNHEQLVTEASSQVAPSSSLTNATTATVGGGGGGVGVGGGDNQGMMTSSSSSSLSSSMANLSDATTDEPRTVLRVIVENMMYSVTLDTLKQIFSRFGPVLKIVTFSKNGSFQALVQYPDPQTAQNAKLTLNGQNMYNGCNSMRVDYSKLPELSVRFNNDKSYDYTNPLLPSGDGIPCTLDRRPMAMAGAPLTHGVKVIPGYGPVVAYTSSAGLPKVQFIHPAMLPVSAAASSLSASGIYLATAAAAAAITTNVLLVANLNEEKVTPDALFTLFGVYGDVIRVKIMFNKQDSALIQFSDAMQAHTAMINLDKLKLWGKVIKVTPSKHITVQMPKEGQPDAGLTKDYTNSSLHRFKKPHSKNYNNIFPPSTTLHLSNIPSTSKETLMDLFGKHGSIEGFKFFQKDCKMALLQMSSVEEAAAALIAMHNYQLAETCHLRVSFSKSSVLPPQGQMDIKQEQESETYD